MRGVKAMTAEEKQNILALLEKAVRLNGEAQNAYDFQAFGNASSMRDESSAILLPLFHEYAVLRESFSSCWAALKRGAEDNGFWYEDLERAKNLFP